MPPKKGPGRRVKTAERALAIIERLRELDGATVTELADEMDLAKSTAHEYLSTLENREYLVVEDGVYRLGLRFLDHGMYVKNGIRVAGIVEDPLQQLADETEEVVWFAVEEHGRVVDLEEARGPRALTVGTWIGRRNHMHHLAAGKAILSQLPDARVEAIVEAHGLPAMTENTITDPADLFAELARIRERGVAFNEEETTLGLRSVGTPVVHRDEVVGAISLTAPANRMRGERFREELPDRLLAATNEVELRLLSADQ